MQLDKGQLASQAQFQRQSARYGKNHILADTSDIAKAAERIDLPGAAQVLDVATGGGHTALFFAKQGHSVTAADIAPMKMPDLDWYLETASTPPENRREVLDLIENAPPEARKCFQLTKEDGKPVWYWARLTLIARKR